MTSTAGRLLVALACVSLRAGAVEVQEGKLSINGFGSWGYGASTHGNSYDFAGPDGHFEDGEFTLALSSRLSVRIIQRCSEYGTSAEAGVKTMFVEDLGLLS